MNEANQNLALEIPGSSHENKAPFELYPMHGRENQRWIYNSDCTLQCVATGMFENKEENKNNEGNYESYHDIMISYC